MPIYLIRAGDTDAVKIGWARDPVARCWRLQQHHYETLTVIREIDGTQLGESWLHRHFAARRIRGEWFRFCPEMMHIEPPPQTKPLVHEGLNERMRGILAKHPGENSPELLRQLLQIQREQERKARKRVPA